MDWATLGRLAEDYASFAVIHADQHNGSIELFAPEYRDVTFIIPHLGSFADDWRAQTACIDAVARHPNVYTDTSGVKRKVADGCPVLGLRYRSDPATGTKFETLRQELGDGFLLEQGFTLLWVGWQLDPPPGVISTPRRSSMTDATPPAAAASGAARPPALPRPS